MPQIGNSCPSNIDPNDATLSPLKTFDSNYCVQECKQQCVPASVLVHIQSKLQKDKHRGWYISVTSLLGCLRQLYLERSIDYFVEPSKSWWMLRGSILHHLLENPGLDSIIGDLVKEVWKRAEMHGTNQTMVNTFLDEALCSLDKLAKILPAKEIPNWEAETEYEYDTGLFVNSAGVITDDISLIESVSNDWTPLFLRGTIDVLRPLTGEMYDYKTIGDKGLGVIKNGAKPDHIMQFNLYRLLVERGWPLGNREGYTPVKINKITAFYMTMMQVVKTGGMLIETTPWRISTPIPKSTMISATVSAEKKELKVKRGKNKLSTNPDDFSLVDNKRFKLTYAIPEVPLLDLDECAAFVKKNVPLLYNGFRNNKMPPMCPPEMRVWKCNDYCPDAVRAACDAHNLLSGEVREVPVKEEAGEIPIEEL